MRIIVFGDTHGRPHWKDIVERETWDLVIFLGDYFTSREGYTEDEQIANFKEIMEFKDIYPDKVILCLGNHDTQAMGYHWADCRPRFYNMWGYDNRDEILKRCQWVYVIGNVVFSHAGITYRWFENIQKKFPEVKTFMDINNLPPSEYFGFTPCKLSDYYGDSETQPITWVRPGCLVEKGVPGYIYVVGHSTNNKIINYKDRCLSFMYDDEDRNWVRNDIWLCDTMPNEYLVVEYDGESFDFIPTKVAK